jgi:hypothetical protein
MDLIYKGNFVGTRRVDFFVEGEVLVELKSGFKLGRRSFGAGNQLFGSIRPECRFVNQFWQHFFAIQKSIQAK